MSQRSQRNRNRTQARNLDDSSESQLSQSTRTANQSISPSQGTENYDQYTVATVKFILNHIATKYPIKRADLVKECCNGNTRIFTAISSAVQNRLKAVSNFYSLNV